MRCLAHPLRCLVFQIPPPERNRDGRHGPGIQALRYRPDYEHAEDDERENAAEAH